MEKRIGITCSHAPIACECAGDAARLIWLALDVGVDAIGKVDIHVLACAYADDDGREEPNDLDYLAAMRRAIDVAMAEAMLDAASEGRGR